MENQRVSRFLDLIPADSEVTWLRWHSPKKDVQEYTLTYRCRDGQERSVRLTEVGQLPQCTSQWGVHYPPAMVDAATVMC